mmetsp:Transcript_11934/g.25932  ORF Transcript_11934/g.25932 Transcript_11934/m.25932 type:complete len:213 (+) Transcript_11934:1219-1857(+)
MALVQGREFSEAAAVRTWRVTSMPRHSVTVLAMPASYVVLPARAPSETSRATRDLEAQVGVQALPLPRTAKKPPNVAALQAHGVRGIPPPRCVPQTRVLVGLGSATLALSVAAVVFLLLVSAFFFVKVLQRRPSPFPRPPQPVAASGIPKAADGTRQCSDSDVLGCPPGRRGHRQFGLRQRLLLLLRQLQKLLLMHFCNIRRPPGVFCGGWD